MTLKAGPRDAACLLLLGAAAAGLALLSREVPVFSFGDAGPDARSLPRAALGLLAAAVLARLLLRRGGGESRAIPLTDLLRIAAVAALAAAGLALMPRLGFLPSAALVGMGTALAFGERKLLFWAGLPLLVAAAADLAARGILNIPLP